MFFTYNNIHSRVRLHYAGNLVFERFSPSEYFYFTPYLITQLQKLAKYKITRDYTFLHRSLPKVWIGYYEGDNGGGTPRLGLSAQETHVFERFSLPEHFACLNLITQLQKLKKIEVFEDFAKKQYFWQLSSSFAGFLPPASDLDSLVLTKSPFFSPNPLTGTTIRYSTVPPPLNSWVRTRTYMCIYFWVVNDWNITHPHCGQKYCITMCISNGWSGTPPYPLCNSVTPPFVSFFSVSLWEKT